MSLDVYLMSDDGQKLYESNITHNLGQMAHEAGIYECLWRPDEHGMTYARNIVSPLSAGLTRLVLNKREFEQWDSPNGWGMWKHFVPFCAEYLQACRDHPDALVTVSR